MKIFSIKVQNFRGVSDSSLERCGPLNVLIGKNNSGKSTMLDAIDAFFRVVGSQQVIALDPPLGSRTDFHRSNYSVPVYVKVEFELSEPDLEMLIDFVIADAPQMKNALEDLDASFRLAVTVLFPPKRVPFAYIGDLSLVCEKTSGRPEVCKRLLSLGDEAAEELYTRRVETRRSERLASNLSALRDRVDPETFQRLRGEGDRTLRGESDRNRRLMLGRYIPPGMSQQARYEVERLISEAASYTEFRENVETLGRSALETAETGAVAPLASTVQTFAGDAQNIPSYAIALISKLAEKSVLHLRDRREPVGREEAKRLLALKVRRGGPEVLRNIQDTVKSLLGVDIDAFESAPSSTAVPSEPSAEMDVDEFLVEMNGAGVREALRLILDNELTTPDILLVEEPEVHLHPALEMSMMRYLKSASEHTQIFVTTHSTNFLDTADMRNVYLFTKNPDTSVRLVDYEEAQEAIPVELGIRLSALFMFDRLVFVEGPSDETVLRELASLLTISLGQANVGFVAMGGARNFSHYATSSTVSFLSRRQVALTFLLDRDESTDDEVSDFIASFNGHATIHVLKRRELENYLIAPRALGEFIGHKRRLAGDQGSPIGVPEITSALALCAENLREDAIARRVVRKLGMPLYPSRERLLRGRSTDELRGNIADEVKCLMTDLEQRATKVEELIARVEEEIASGWEQNRLNVVPGDELVDCVCKEFGTRFKKERDAGRLASLLRPEEVPAELREFLGTVTA